MDYFVPDALTSFQKRRNSSIIPSVIVGSMGWGGPNNVNPICLQGPLSEQTLHRKASEQGILLIWALKRAEEGGARGRSSKRAALGAREPWAASGPSLGLHSTSMPLARA